MQLIADRRDWQREAPPINRNPDDKWQCQIRMEAAADLLTLASSRLKDVMLSGPAEAIDEAHLCLRIARMRFREARTRCRESGVIL